jgi:hypothetical protein
MASAPSAKKLPLEQLEGLVGLARTNMAQPHGPSNKIRQLQTHQVGSFVGENHVKWPSGLTGLCSIAEAPEFELQLGVLPLAATFDHEMSDQVVLFLFRQKRSQ